MNCLTPLYGWQSKHREPDGSRKPVFSRRDAYVDLPLIPMRCGKCEPCRMDRQNELAVRIVHEASLHSQNCIFHLTFDEAHLRSSSLSADQADYFVKNLAGILGEKPRLLMVGEYGTCTKRKHYHGCLFGHDLLGGARPVGNGRYQSPILKACWPYGFHQLGLMGIDGASYVAKYLTEDYGIDSDYKAKIRWPRSPALAYNWAARYFNDIRTAECVIINGKECPIPQKYFEWFPTELADVKANRKAFALSQSGLSHGERVVIAENKLINRKAKIEVNGKGKRSL